MPISRRQLLQGVVAFGLAGCAGPSKLVLPASSSTMPATTGPPDPTAATTSTAVPATTATSTATSTATTAAPAGDRVLVVVQLSGGNDGLNTLVPAAGQYRDLRPTLAIPEQDVVALSGLDGFGLHPALAPLGALWDARRLAFVEAIGFADPNRSHFVSLDRWWRADDAGAPAGWLGRVLDGLGAEPVPLYATALGAGAPLLNGAVVQPTVVRTPGSFRWAETIDAAGLEALTMPASTDVLTAAAQHALARTIDAVGSIGSLGGAAAPDEDIPDREGGATLTAGLTTAAQLVTAGLGTRMVVVSASGFDTHANQLATHERLLGDLATGITTFFRNLGDAADRVLLVTTSEFGRRVGENGSGGFDHGAGGLSLMVGAPVVAGVHGSLDLDDLLDGDVRPSVDPRTLYTACLDWLGVDPVPVLGRRYEDERLITR